jgi:hypothetical protein
MRKRMREAIAASMNKRVNNARRQSAVVDERPFVLTRGKAAVLQRDGVSLFEVVRHLMSRDPPRTYEMLAEAETEVRCFFMHGVYSHARIMIPFPCTVSNFPLSDSLQCDMYTGSRKRGDLPWSLHGYLLGSHGHTDAYDL